MKKQKASKSHSYTAEFKLKVVRFSHKHGKNQAAHQFKVNRKSVHRWVGIQKDLCFAVFDRKWRNGRGSDSTNSNNLVEYELYEWVKDEMAMYATGATSQDVNKPNKNTNEVPPPTIKQGQLNNNITPQPPAITLNSTATKQSYEEEILSTFHKMIRTLHSTYDYQLRDVGLVAETCVPFKTSSNRSSLANVLLCALADGTKLKPLVIFKCHDIKDTIKIPSQLHITVNGKGSPQDPEILWWLKNVWGGTSSNKYRLLLTSISSTKSQESLQSLANKYCLTNVVQVPTRTDFISQLFQDTLKSDGTCEGINQVLRLIDNAWEKVGGEFVFDGFKESDIVGDDVYVKEEPVFVGFSQEDIDLAKENARKMYNDVNDIINTLI